jgi:hypothetical protein
MFDNFFNHIDISIDWGLLFGLISILSLVFAWVVKTFRDPNKDISVKEAVIEKLLNRPNEFQNELKIILNGTEIEQLNKISLFLRNTGTSSLNSEDFHILPRMNLSGFTNIISLNISSSNEFTKCETSEIEPSIVEFKLDNWEPKDFVRVEILFESLSNEFESSFEYRLKEQKKKERNLKEFRIDKHIGISKDYNGFMFFPMFAAGIVYGLSYFIVKYGLKVDLSDLNKFGIGWKILFFIPTVLTGIYVVYKWNTTIRDFHFAHLKIDKWHFMTSKNKLKD